ncbi:acyl-CoA dehydrogenase family protein [Actinomadura oligospora]|uniref:acyl-CoA dehydrogenase family protein n=1 Tax=Actinomadura oligospora TaxID=111804 RepID=UPI000688117A|nr:acyl-CoA dehydrogenase family protein [Actinomadura oligospora]
MTTTLTLAAGKVAVLASEHAVEADARRALSPEVVQALVNAGFARHSVPVAQGGAEASFSELLAALVEVGKGCASASWCGLTLASSGRIASFLPAEGREEIWDLGADTPLASALPPAGRAVRVPGGWELSGRWAFVSGIDFAEWALVCVLTKREDEVEPLFCALRRDEYRIDDTWFTLGMRGTGSRTVVVDGVFVPDRRTCAQRDVVAGRNGEAAPAGRGVPVRGAMPPLFVAPALGAALAALTVWAGELRAKKRDGLPVPRHPGLREVLARSSAELDAARLVVERASAVADAGQVSEDDVVRAARDATLAADLVRAAVNRLVRQGGTSVQTDGHPLQRAWRDVNGALSHAMLRPEFSAAPFTERAYWPVG